VINQVRLLRRTSLLDALEANPRLSRDQARRLRELRRSSGSALPNPRLPRRRPLRPPSAGPRSGARTRSAHGRGARGARTAQRAGSRGAAARAEEQEDEEKVSAVQRIYKLNTAQKLICALKGNREERAILVRDRNRLVSMAVLGSPKITESEIEAFSGMKNISDEILRAIGTHREWTKKYSVVSSLVRNRARRSQWRSPSSRASTRVTSRASPWTVTSRRSCASRLRSSSGPLPRRAARATDRWMTTT